MTDEPLLRVFDVMNRLVIPYMLTGSYASNIYGKVRSTFDADIVAAIHASALKGLIAALEREFYLDSRSLTEIQEAGGQFNAVHKTSGLKIDFYLVGPTEYDQVAFSRRISQEFFGREVSVIAPEDLILSKLRWAKSGGSGRQLEDAQGVYYLQKERLDLPYLRHWASRLSILEELDRLK